jgi:Cu/Ag efflux protein CusF
VKTPISSALVFTISLLLATSAGAQVRHDDNGSTHGIARTTGKGTITKIDLPAKLVTLDHDAIGKFKMEAGTHDFHARSANTLAKVTVGDKVDFSIESSGKVMQITKISKQK